MSGAVEGVVLLPCPNPWCESAVPPMPFVNRDGTVAVICGCDFHGPAAASRAEAIVAWNSRTQAPDYKAAWEALSKPLFWMHDNPRLTGYWGLNLADIANDLIDRAYPGLRTGNIVEPSKTADMERIAGDHVEAFKAQSHLGGLMDGDETLLASLFTQAILAALTTPPARSYADGVEDAAKVAEGIATGKMAKSDELRASEDPIDVEYSVAFHRQGSTGQQIAAAIRLLSQGGKA